MKYLNESGKGVSAVLYPTNIALGASIDDSDSKEGRIKGLCNIVKCKVMSGSIKSYGLVRSVMDYGLYLKQEEIEEERKRHGWKPEEIEAEIKHDGNGAEDQEKENEELLEFMIWKEWMWYLDVDHDYLM